MCQTENGQNRNLAEIVEGMSELIPILEFSNIDRTLLHLWETRAIRYPLSKFWYFSVLSFSILLFILLIIFNMEILGLVLYGFDDFNSYNILFRYFSTSTKYWFSDLLVWSNICLPIFCHSPLTVLQFYILVMFSSSNFSSSKDRYDHLWFSNF